MTTLHMEVDVARSAQRSMDQAYQEMSASLQKMQSAVNNLRGGAWQGNAANEFFTQYDQLYSQLKNLCDQLMQLSTRLQGEIVEWETAAGKLG